MRKHKGFTLVEILIVVVILGILAAIVIPQFSQASTEARINSLASNLQTVRSQLSLYRIQHNDQWPTSDAIVAQMTGRTLQNGTADAAGAFGPYLQSIPSNPFTGGNTIGTATTADWVYDAATGSFTAGYGGGTAITVEVNGASVAISTF